MYIGLVLLREIAGEQMQQFGQAYMPILYHWAVASHARWITVTLPAEEQSSPRSWLWFWIEVWCYLEAIFYIWLCVRIRWLQCQDPLEASLSAAPILSLEERRSLWRDMSKATPQGTVRRLISGWFFRKPNVEDISVYDIRDFLAWSMFEGRHQEHLTDAELEQLEEFIEEWEYRISLEIYGAREDDGGDIDLDSTDAILSIPEWKVDLQQPQKCTCLCCRIQLYCIHLKPCTHACHYCSVSIQNRNPHGRDSELFF